MKASMQLNFSQQLTLTPQLQQAIRLLQLSTLDLVNEVQQAVESNPMLEMEVNPVEPSTQKDSEHKVEEKPTTSNETKDNEINWEDYYPGSGAVSTGSYDEDINFENFHTRTEGLYEHLLWQLQLTPISETDQAIAMAIIDAIDDDGYLTCSLEDIQTTVSSQDINAEAIELDEINAVLHLIQRFDPIGCGAKDLQECLLIQLGQLANDTPYLTEAKTLIEQHSEILAGQNLKQLLRQTKFSEATLQATLKLIRCLNPNPGSEISSDNTEYVIPDVVVKKDHNRWQVTLNPDALPKVRINKQYAALIQRGNSSRDNTFMKENLQEAKWLIKSLQSRHETLLKVANRIVETQQDFFEHGEEAMKPMVLHDIADALDMHESTISRVTTKKYMHTPRGVYELKYFFSSHVGTSAGGECSSTAIRAVIKKLIAAENHQKPLSDNQIAKIIGDQGINVARRTIAKYREAMGIPSSSERKSLVL